MNGLQAYPASFNAAYAKIGGTLTPNSGQKSQTPVSIRFGGIPLTHPLAKTFENASQAIIAGQDKDQVITQVLQSPLLTPTVKEALEFAHFLHHDQTRKGGPIPYITHLLSVAAIALEHGANEVETAASLLHDTVEDQGDKIDPKTGLKTKEALKKRFGDDIFNVVMECTDAEVIPKPPYYQRKQAYIDAIPHKSDSGRRVSASDKLHNATAILDDFRKIGDALWKRFNAGKPGTLWYLRNITDAFKKHGPEPLATKLNDVVTQLEKETAG